MKISARNKMQGEVVSVERDKVMAVIKVKIDVPSMVTSSITREAVDELEIKKGDRVTVVVKASSVMILKED